MNNLTKMAIIAVIISIASGCATSNPKPVNPEIAKAPTATAPAVEGAEAEKPAKKKRPLVSGSEITKAAGTLIINGIIGILF